MLVYTSLSTFCILGRKYVGFRHYYQANHKHFNVLMAWLRQRGVGSDCVAMQTQGTVSTGHITCGTWGVILSDSVKDTPPFRSTDLCMNPKSIGDVSALLKFGSCAGSVFWMCHIKILYNVSLLWPQFYDYVTVYISIFSSISRASMALSNEANHSKDLKFSHSQKK